MDFLLPREVLNEVGGRSPCRGVSDTSSSGSHRSFSVSLDSEQENVLARGMDHLGIFDQIGGPASQILQPQQVKSISLSLLPSFAVLIPYFNLSRIPWSVEGPSLLRLV